MQKLGYVNSSDWRNEELIEINSKPVIYRRNQSISNEEFEAMRQARIQEELKKPKLQETLQSASKVKRITKDCRSACQSAHPSYKSGYTTRQFNYLKSSSKQNGEIPGILSQLN